MYWVIASPLLTVGAVQETSAAFGPETCAVTDVGAGGVMAIPHLWDRYSSTARRRSLFRAELNVMTSPTWPSTPRFPNELETLAANDRGEDA